jgi:hypothetical protein
VLVTVASPRIPRRLSASRQRLLVIPRLGFLSAYAVLVPGKSSRLETIILSVLAWFDLLVRLLPALAVD